MFFSNSIDLVEPVCLFRKKILNQQIIGFLVYVSNTVHEDKVASETVFQFDLFVSTILLTAAETG